MFGTFHFLVEWSNSKFKGFKNPTVHPKLPILWNLFVNLIYITSYYNITQVSKNKNDLNIENEQVVPLICGMHCVFWADVSDNKQELLLCPYSASQYHLSLAALTKKKQKKKKHTPCQALCHIIHLLFSMLFSSIVPSWFPSSVRVELRITPGCNVFKTFVVPVAVEPSVIVNMLFLCILIKASLLIKPSHYLQFAVNSISLLILDPLQRRRKMAASTSETASFGRMAASNILSCGN